MSEPNNVEDLASAQRARMAKKRKNKAPASTPNTPEYPAAMLAQAIVQRHGTVYAKALALAVIALVNKEEKA